MMLCIHTYEVLMTIGEKGAIQFAYSDVAIFESFLYLSLVTLYQTIFEILQNLKEPCGTIIKKKSSELVSLPMDVLDDCSQRHWRNVVLEHMCQSLSDDEGGIQRCIRKALVTNQGIDCMTTVKVYLLPKLNLIY